MRAELAMTAVIIPFPRHRTELNGFSPDDITELRRWASLVGPRGLRLLTALDPMSRTESIVARLSDGTELASVTTEEGSEASSFDILRSRVRGDNQGDFERRSGWMTPGSAAGRA